MQVEVEPARAPAQPEVLTFLKLALLAKSRKGEVLEGYYGVADDSGVIRRYVVDCPKRGKWAGWLFLRTGSDYNDRKTLLMRGPIAGGGHFTRSTSDRGKEVLASILIDPAGCLLAYGQVTGQCGVCGRKLEDPNSVAIGIGPVCLGRVING